MNILILNGSPAGKDSITLQTVEYIKVFHPGHQYTLLHVGQQIRKIEKDFAPAREALEEADLIIFCYPVYTFLVPAQLHRFIELIKENGVDLSGKYAVQITTSKHFYDVTAHRFVEENCADLGMRTLRGLSADMEDLLTKRGQKEARAFFRHVLWCIRNGYEEPVRGWKKNEVFEPVTATRRSSEDAALQRRSCISYRAAIVTDYDPAESGSALQAMIRRFLDSFPWEYEVINLREFSFAGGCLGCFHCAGDGTCIYKDGFDRYLREHINDADAVIYAFTIRDHSMGYRFKLYDDRQFCNGHRTVTMGKPVAYLVDGDLDSEENLRLLMESRAQVGGNYLAGVASDREDPDREIDQLVLNLVYALRHQFTQPKNFYGVGGLKIFRDLIYEMQGLMKEDHRFYKKHGFYKDFPQKHKGKIAGMYMVSAMMKSSFLRKKSKISMTEGMLMPYKKVIEQAETQKK